LRYEETTGLPYTETYPGLLAYTVALALLIGIILFIVGRMGRQMWLVVWSVGLVFCSIAYLIWHFFIRV
jgi:hypothetical protein